jgi:hypothetical protein
LEQNGQDLVAEGSELLPPSHCWEVASMNLVADLSDRALHHLSYMRGGEHGRVLRADLLYRADPHIGEVGVNVSHQ